MLCRKCLGSGVQPLVDGRGNLVLSLCLSCDGLGTIHEAEREEDLEEMFIDLGGEANALSNATDR